MNIQMITAANTIGQLQKKVNTIGNNIANLNTVGYKKRDASFKEMLNLQINNQPYQNQEVGRETPQGIRIGQGAMIGQTSMNTDQGSVQITNRPLDLMIEGEEGWFRVRKTWVDNEGNERQEIVYTRNGAFQLQPDPENSGRMRLATSEGWPLINENGFTVSFERGFERMEITQGGQVNAYYPGYEDQPDQQSISVAQVQRPDLLQSMGGSLFRLEGNVEQLENEGVLTIINNLNNIEEKPFTIRSGALEMSNVKLSQEMTDLISTQRLMQFQTKSIKIADEMLGIANSIRG